MGDSTCFFFFSCHILPFEEIIDLKYRKITMRYFGFGPHCFLLATVLFVFFFPDHTHMIFFLSHTHSPLQLPTHPYTHMLIEIRKYFIILCIPQHTVLPWAEGRRLPLINSATQLLTSLFPGAVGIYKDE